MIRNGSKLLDSKPLDPMVPTKERAHGTSYGLAEAGADIRVKQAITFTPPDPVHVVLLMKQALKTGLMDDVKLQEAFHGYVEVDGERTLGRFALASSVERFQVPPHLVAIMGHKSTWARRGVNVWAGTTAEPAWEGWLTLEIGFHGNEPVTIPAGSGIAQVLFHELAEAGDYGGGKYANQADRPVAAIMECEA